MGSLFEELEAREAAARVRVEEFEAELAAAALSLPAGRHSIGLRRSAITEAVRGSFDQAHDVVERRCGNGLGKRRLEELVVAAAADVHAF